MRKSADALRDGLAAPRAGAAHAVTPLDRRSVQTFGLAALGGMLEFYDFIIFVFFTAYIGRVFFPPSMAPWLKQAEVWGLFSAGYLARPIGGLAMAHFGDRAGRKRMFMLGVVLMAAPTFAIGLLPGYAQVGVAAPLLLLACRVLQGAAVGGEVPGAWVFVSEHAPAGRVGLACGLLTAGLTGGILLGSLVNTLLTALLPPTELASFGWRAAFLFGGVLGFGGALLRRRLAETPVFEALRRERRLARGLPVATVLRTHLASVVTSMFATWLLTAAIVVLILMGPTLLQQRGVAAAWTAPASLAATASLTLGCVLAGLAVDRFGLRPVALVGAAGIAFAGYLLLGRHVAGAGVLPVYAVVGLLVGSVTIVPVFMVRAFPPAVAFSGVSFAYNVAYAIAGGLTPPLVIAIGHVRPLFPAHYVALVSVVGAAAVALKLQTRRSRQPEAQPAA